VLPSAGDESSCRPCRAILTTTWTHPAVPVVRLGQLGRIGSAAPTQRDFRRLLRAGITFVALARVPGKAPAKGSRICSRPRSVLHRHLSEPVPDRRARGPGTDKRPRADGGRRYGRGRLTFWTAGDRCGAHRVAAPRQFCAAELSAISTRRRLRDEFAGRSAVWRNGWPSWPPSTTRSCALSGASRPRPTQPTTPLPSARACARSRRAVPCSARARAQGCRVRGKGRLPLARVCLRAARAGARRGAGAASGRPGRARLGRAVSRAPDPARRPAAPRVGGRAPSAAAGWARI
jgi:hypothetical protein